MPRQLKKSLLCYCRTCALRTNYNFAASGKHSLMRRKYTILKQIEVSKIGVKIVIMHQNSDKKLKILKYVEF